MHAQVRAVSPAASFVPVVCFQCLFCRVLLVSFLSPHPHQPLPDPYPPLPDLHQPLPDPYQTLPDKVILAQGVCVWLSDDEEVRWLACRLWVPFPSRRDT